jgi:hypothetical protein
MEFRRVTMAFLLSTHSKFAYPSTLELINFFKDDKGCVHSGRNLDESRG